MLNEEVNTAPADILVLPMTEDLTAAAQAATYLRSVGIRTQLYAEQRKFKAKMSYADKLKIPFVAFMGEDEAAQGKISLKNMTTGTQDLLTLEEAAEQVKDTLAKRNVGTLIRG